MLLRFGFGEMELDFARRLRLESLRGMFRVYISCVSNVGWVAVRVNQSEAWDFTKNGKFAPHFTFSQIFLDLSDIQILRLFRWRFRDKGASLWWCESWLLYEGLYWQLAVANSDSVDDQCLFCQFLSLELNFGHLMLNFNFFDSFWANQLSQLRFSEIHRVTRNNHRARLRKVVVRLTFITLIRVKPTASSSHGHFVNLAKAKSLIQLYLIR